MPRPHATAGRRHQPGAAGRMASVRAQAYLGCRGVCVRRCVQTRGCACANAFACVCERLCVRARAGRCWRVGEEGVCVGRPVRAQ
eukprot:4914136-Pleurochrysis_carterae.AAC.1